MKFFIAASLFLFVSCTESLTDDEKKITFEQSEFNQSIAIDLPSESSKERYQKIIDNPVLYTRGAILKVGSGNESSYRHNSLLKELDFISMEDLKQKEVSDRGIETEEAYEFIFYTDKLRQYMSNEEVKSNN